MKGLGVGLLAWVSVMGFTPAAADGNLNLSLASHDLSPFAQDAWQVRPDLTVSLGVRDDYSRLFGDDKKSFTPRLGVEYSNTLIDVGVRYLFGRK